MRKWTKPEMPTERSSSGYWKKFYTSHGFETWSEMGESIHNVKSWDGCITYDTYSLWFDIYNSPLYKALQEEE